MALAQTKVNAGGDGIDWIGLDGIGVELEMGEKR